MRRLLDKLMFASLRATYEAQATRARVATVLQERNPR